MIVYGIAWVIFDVSDGSHGGDTSRLDEADSGKFRLLVFIVVGVGLFFCIIFHLGVREHKEESSDREKILGESSALNTIEQSTLNKLKMSWKCWLKEHQFYQVAVIYMSTRLVVNVSQVYLPMFITETVKLDKDSIAIIPLVVYVSGFVTSLLMRYVNKAAGRKITYFIGILFALGSCAWFWFLKSGSGSKQVYGAAILSGIGGSTMLVTSLAMCADLIKQNTESGAFVYGAMSFTDKLSNGAAIALIQDFHPCTNCCPKCVEYYRKIIVFVPGGFALVALVALCTLIPQTLGTRRKKVTMLEQLPNGSAPDGHVQGSTYESSDEREPLLRSGKSSINS